MCERVSVCRAEGEREEIEVKEDALVVCVCACVGIEGGRERER